MKAIIYETYGEPDVLELKDVPKPKCNDDEALIRVRAAEATKADCELRSFKFSVKWFWLPLRLAVGILKPRRPILGGYFAGEIVQVGKEVTDLSVGDAVFGSAGLHMGAYAEYMALPATHTVVAKPANMSFAEAAAVPLGGLNALHFMRSANIRPDETILINGAGGSIGAHAVQIAKAMGALVTAVDHARKQDMLQRLGADHVVDYNREDFRRAGQRYDVIFDMVPSGSYSGCIKLLKPGGRYLSGNPRFFVMIRSLLTNWFTDKSASFAFAGETKDELDDLRDMIEAGTIRPIVDRVLPMNKAADAHRLVETEERLGVIVISIANNSPDA